MARKNFVNTYSRLDRVLHRMAFASGGLQEAVADIEDRLNARRLARIPLSRPVFITALPRAGTTMLLTLLYATGEFATHTYRSMPFVLCPLTWHKLSGALRSRERLEMERAHGDGISISADSAEAFEEMLWRQFFGAHYKENCIEPWEQGGHPEFTRFFENHLRKQLLLDESGSERRYMSKNNMNVARIPLLRHLYPDADIIVPFRDPLQQACSLLRQHRRFLELHSVDRFSREYMHGIGHYDFGANFLPINFGGWIDGDRRNDAEALPFWLEYWQNAYRTILRMTDAKTRLISFEGLTSRPQASLQQIADLVGLRSPDALVRQSHELHQAALHETDLTGVDPSLLESVRETCNELNDQASVPL